MISLTIDHPGDSDQRIDKFLKKYLKDAPLGGIYKWLRTGKIKVNRKKVDQNYRITLGDVIDIYLLESDVSMFQKNSPSHTKQKNTGENQDESSNKGHRPLLEILYEDAGLIVVNKPPGINVHPSDHKSVEVSLIELVQDSLAGKYDTLSFRPSLVHRIDRDTSGVIMIAKDKKMLESLLALLQGGKIEKIYHAIVVSKPHKTRDTIRAPLLRIENAKDESKVRIDPLGQKAITHYQTLEHNIKEKYSLLEVRIETGRMHQIRVHMSSINCPILGDKSYGNSGENSFARRNYGIIRQLLHAQSIEFTHPLTKERLSIKAPYPDDMRLFLEEVNGKAS